MTAKAIWKGNIRFGPLDLPVRLHTAVRQERISFHLLHEPDRVKLRQEMVCAHENVAVPLEEQVRGFEVEEGKFLLVGPEELEELDPEASRTIEVQEFVRAGQIDPVFVERLHYLSPDSGAAGYEALASAMAGAGVDAICTWTMRRRSYLGVLRAAGQGLRLTTLRYFDEVVPAAALELPSVALSERELQIGEELIAKLTTPFQPETFENSHEAKLRELIERKARGEKIVLLPPRRLKATASDKLLEALEASLRKVA